MNLQNAKSFMLAGNATVTFQNTETGNRFTFKIRKPNKNTPHFVKVLTGSNNEEDYTFLGTIFESENYRHGRRSRINKEAQSAKVFNWVWSHLDNLPQQIEIHHEGRCGRCGRKLTVPESIESGFGPECINKI